MTKSPALHRCVWRFGIVVLLTVLASCVTFGEVEERAHEHGNYHLYVPESYTAASDVVVVVHGTPGKNEDANAVAQAFIERWTDFADTTASIIVAPVFDQEKYASKQGVYGGYRGLYGREVGADEFLHQILAQVDLIAPTSEQRFYLYGFSAGGQFANRYVVRHPDRVLGVIIGAAGRYAFPEDRLYGEEVKWHYGMGSINTEIKWPNGEETKINIEPDPEGWARAASRPITIIVGSEDEDPQPCRPAYCGHDRTQTTRKAIGFKWFADMGMFAGSKGYTSQMDYEIVRGVGPNPAGLTDECQDVLRDWIE